MNQNQEIGKDPLSNSKGSKRISLSENTQHEPFNSEAKETYSLNPNLHQTETEGQEAMLSEKGKPQNHHSTKTFFRLDHSANNLHQLPSQPKTMSLINEAPYLKNELAEMQEKLPNNSRKDPQSTQDNANMKSAYKCLKAVNLFLTPLKKKIVFIVLLALSSALTIQSIIEAPLQYGVMNQLWYFLLEVIDTILIEALFALFVLLKQTSTLLIINNALVMLLLINQLVIFAIKNYSIAALILNVLFAFFMTSGCLFSISLINSTLKSQKNVMQNIEEIINFTDIAEEPKTEIKGQ